ncbi:MAG: flexitail domain-containing putative surface protein [Dehalococcoidia bacterium]
MGKTVALVLALTAIALALGSRHSPTAIAEAPTEGIGDYGQHSPATPKRQWPAREGTTLLAPAGSDTIIISGVPPATFRIPDPTGDTFGAETFQPNITLVSGSVDATTLYLTVQFSSPISPADAGNGMEVLGFIDFDTDRNPATGSISGADAFCVDPPGMPGSDVLAALGNVAGGQLPMIDPSDASTIDTVPITFGGTSFTAAIPLADLGGDRSFDANMVLGSFDEPTDCAPNGMNMECAGGFCTVGPDYPACAPIGKDGFETGIVGSSVVPCWTGIASSTYAGGWCNQTGAVPPEGDCAINGGSGAVVQAPPQGLQAVMANGDGPGSHVLYRCGIPTKNTVGFELHLHNLAVDYATPNSLDSAFAGNNQQFRADIVTVGGITSDPFTVAPSDILLNLYQTDPGDPLDAGYTTVTANIASVAGQNVCLRFAEVDNLFYFNVGIDDVRFEVKARVADTDSDGCENALENGTNAALGGRRNYLNFWDFFDTPGPANVRDHAVSVGDIFRVVGRFGATGDLSMSPLAMPPASGYHTAFDRSSTVPGGDSWDLQPPDGVIATNDILFSVIQFGHSCATP